jgi:hypothetical protein
VLQAFLKVMRRLGVSVSALNFKEADYIDKQGKPRKMIEFSEDVLANVL